MQTTEPTVTTTAEARIAALESALAEVTRERDLLRASHERLRLELELLKRRIVVAKAERVDTTQLELEFLKKLAELNQLAGTPKAAPESDTPSKKKRPRPTGRRDLKDAPLEEKRVEITDPLFEDLVQKGLATRIGHEESCKLGYQRGGMRRVVIARVKYRAIDGRGESELETAPMPPQALERSLAAPSMLAHVAITKHCEGLPLFRLEDRFSRSGFPVDRGTMCRWLEDLGGTLGSTVVAAARAEALKTAFCIATDATGVAVQPDPLPDKKRQPCRRGHYFVLVADRDHVFFEYTPKENGAAVKEMLRGYSGYVQADAKSVFDVLFPSPNRPPGDDEGTCTEVGCWAHCRRHFWEAAFTKSVVAREALARIGRIFEVDEGFSDEAPAKIARLRQAHLEPHLDAFFSWAEAEYELVREQRGLLRSALGYAVRQKDALLRVLEDGRLKLDNNRSERGLRTIAVGRKAWLFVGSDDHAVSAGHLFSLIASARLHGLDPESYLRDVIRVLGHWPRDRYLELSPKYWAGTRARLDAGELAMEVGPLTVPAPLAAAEQTPVH